MWRGGVGAAYLFPWKTCTGLQLTRKANALLERRRNLVRHCEHLYALVLVVTSEDCSSCIAVRIRVSSWTSLRKFSRQSQAGDDSTRGHVERPR